MDDLDTGLLKVHYSDVSYSDPQCILNRSDQKATFIFSPNYQFLCLAFNKILINPAAVSSQQVFIKGLLFRQVSNGATGQS